MKQFKLFLSVLLLLCCIHTAAQNTVVPSDEETTKKKEINKIKMSEQAVYADIMEIASDDEEAISLAHQKSQDMLQAHVIEIFAKRMKMSKKDVQEIWDVIDDKCQNIVVKKGDLFRVFSYIMKDAIGLSPKKPKEGDVEKYMEKPALTDSVVADSIVENPVIEATPIAQNPIVADSVFTTQPKDSVVQTKVEEPQETPTIQSLPQETQPQPQEIQPQPQEVQPQPQEVETPVVSVPVVQPTETVVQPATPLTPAVEIPDRVKIMLDKSSINEIISYLNTEKQNHTLIYGSMSTMQNPEKCYIIVIDKATKKVISMLSQGSDNRINYITGQPDNLNNYKGGKHSAIFVQEY